MKSVLHRLAWLLCMAVGLAACSSLAPHSIDVDKGRLDAAIARRFPYERSWLGFFDVRVTAPQLRLMPERNRIATDVELSLVERFSGRELRGALSFESGLRYEPGDATLRLAQVSVDRFALAGLPDALMSQTGPLGSLLATQLLEGAVLYQLTDAQKASLHSMGVQPGEMHVTAQGLSIDLVPAPAP
jgi:hypothetical protein